MTPHSNLRPGSELYAQETRLRLEALQKSFEEHVADQAAEWAEMERILDQLKKDVDHAMHGRPTWPVTWIITTLASLCTALIVAFLTNGR